MLDYTTLFSWDGDPGRRAIIAKNQDVPAETAMLNAHEDSMRYRRLWKPFHPIHGGTTA